MGTLPGSYGQYELLELVETAPLYQLFLARRSGESGFSKKVLLRRLAPTLEADAPSTEVFAAAAKLASSLLHPRIVHTHELGSVGRSLYVTMEYANGVDLAAVQKDLVLHERELPAQIGVWIAHEILDAVAHAHGMSIVHGDLTAARVLIGAAGDIKLKDFGIAQALHRTKRDDPTPLAASDDLLAVGILLAEFVTGWPLFVTTNAPNLWSTLEQIHPMLVEVDLALADIVLKALRKAPRHRWATAAAFRDALGEWLFDRRHRVTGQDVIAAVMPSAGGKDRRPSGTPLEGVPATPKPASKPAAPALARGTERAYQPLKRDPVVTPVARPRLQRTAMKPIRVASDTFTNAYNAAPVPAAPPANALAGSFSAVASPLRVLFRLATSRATGVFVVSAGAVKKQVSIDDGRVTAVTSNVSADRFDSYLVTKQLLTPRELAGAAAMTSEHADLVDTIIGLGLLGPRDVRRHVSDHLRAVIVDVCTWRRGEYTWCPKQSPSPKLEGVTVDLFDAIGAASSAISDRAISEWAAAHATLTPSPTPRVDPDRFHVEGLGELLISVGKRASVVELAGAQRDSRQRRLRMLYLLEACELVVPG